MNIRQIRSLVYCQEYDKAINMLCDEIEKLQKEIKELKEEKNAEP
jgi:FtsZ-binding cell division protein ZapB